MTCRIPVSDCMDMDRLALDDQDPFDNFAAELPLWLSDEADFDAAIPGAYSLELDLM